MMKMESLQSLHQSMKQLGLDKQRFTVRVGAANLECLFCTSDGPYSLALTSRGEKPSFAKLDVHRGYLIDDFFGDQYQYILDMLRVDGHAGERLVPKTFLAQLDGVIPRKATQQNVPTASDILGIRHDIEDRDRPHFDCWIYWTKPQSPTKENMAKTKLILGGAALKHSKTHNASSRWSADPTGASWHDGIGTASN